MEMHSTGQININPVDVLLWTFRRREADVINLYDTLASLMQVSTGNNMLNFGYWNKETPSPQEAQVALCKRVAEMAEFGTARNVLDVGSGFSEPAVVWRSGFSNINIFCLNLNSTQLKFASKILKTSSNPASPSHLEPETIGLVNSTATKFPFADKSMDRIVALESAQHFKPFSEFVSESKRVLSEKGILALAIPVVRSAGSLQIFKLGILSFTWSSEHYTLESLKETVSSQGFTVSSEMIGSRVYRPLADYYMKNRERLRPRILRVYPPYVEKILFKSLQKMKQVSENDLIEYALLKCAIK